MNEAIYFKEDEQTLYIKAVGHITALLCTDLKKKAINRLMQQPPIMHIEIDLSECEYMDSTFMGLIVGLNKKLKKTIGTRVDIINACKMCEELLKSLGVYGLLNHPAQPIHPFPADMSTLDPDPTTSASLLLRAHENLMELSDANKKKFAILHQVLKKQAEDKPN